MDEATTTITSRIPTAPSNSSSSTTTTSSPGEPAPLVWPLPPPPPFIDMESPIPLDASEGGLFSEGGFVPPPPRPSFVDDSATPDGPTTCDLCSWAWQNTGGGGGGRLGLSGGYGGVFNSTVEVPGEIGWVLTLVIVSLTSAILGAIVMIVVLHCKRIKTSSESDHERNVVSLNHITSAADRRHHPQLPNPLGDKEDITVIRPTADELSHHHHQSNASGVWSWLQARRSSTSRYDQHRQQFGVGAPVENHYTHMEDGYNICSLSPSTMGVGGEDTRDNCGDEDALYAELDRSASPVPSSNGSPAYHNSAYADPDAPPSAPSSAYYSDLSSHTTQGGVAQVQQAPQPNEKAYEVVGLATLHPQCWGDSGRNKLEAISEHGTVPSDYV